MGKPHPEMTITPPVAWQEIGWDGLYLRIPAAWQPTAVHPAYLFSEMEGSPVFEIKWQPGRGRFAAKKILNRLRDSLPGKNRLESWAIPGGLQKLLTGYVAAGFELRQNNRNTRGLVLHCPECERVSLLQWYLEAADELPVLMEIFGSFRDHDQGPDRIWAMYDIRALLPAAARLRSHEFLPGRYTLCFDLGATTITLYRFKPASVLLGRKSLSEFARELIGRDCVEQGEGWAAWLHRAQGLELLLAKARRNPVWQWMRFRHDQENNVLLGVKAEGKPYYGTELLERICENYVSS